MARGDQQDMLARLRGVLPQGWFPDDAPVLGAVLTGIAYSLSWAFSLTAYAADQTRLLTAADVFLDILAVDFFGGRLFRKDNETDASFRARIRRELLRPKATRAALAEALTDLTGQAPAIFEPGNSTDTGGYDLGGCGYDAAGGYGAPFEMPYQCLVTAYRPHLGGIPGVDGYDGSIGGYGQGALEYADPSQILGAVTDQDILDLIVATIPAATVAWTRITNVPPVAGSRLDIDLALGRGTLA